MGFPSLCFFIICPSQRAQTPIPPRLITAFIARFKLTTWRSALRINRAADGLPDVTIKRNASTVGLIRAAHGNVVVINRLGHFFGNRTVRMRGGLRPVE